MSVKYEHSDQRKSPLISIIIPVYNLFCYIEECITSIQKQTYDNIEIIIVDDGSTDNSGDLCEKLAEKDERIQVIKQENMGVVAARGAGIEASSGEYISFIDGDDWIEPDMIGALVSQMDGVDLVSSGLYRQFTPERIIKKYDDFPEGRYIGEQQLSVVLEKMLYDQESETLQRLTPWCVNKLYRADLVKQVYGEINPQITYAEDSVFLYKYLLKCQSFVVIRKCFYHYRYREESAIHTVNKHILTDVNLVYLSLKKDFQKHVLGESLLYQLQKWVSFMSCKALNEHMNFDNRIHIPEYIADLSGLDNKKLIVYGAGDVGKDTCFQLNNFGYQIVLWVDKDWRFYQNKGLSVADPKEIDMYEYDMILIAVHKSELAKRIKNELMEKKISEDKLIWKKPMRIY